MSKKVAKIRWALEVPKSAWSRLFNQKAFFRIKDLVFRIKDLVLEPSNQESQNMLTIRQQHPPNAEKNKKENVSDFWEAYTEIRQLPNQIGAKSKGYHNIDTKTGPTNGQNIYEVNLSPDMLTP